jgi:hypothetical protein
VRSLTTCREAAPVLAGTLASHIADVAQLVERDLAKVEARGSSPLFRSTSGVPLHHRRRAAVGTARRDVHGVAPLVQREHLVSLLATRAWTQPKWNLAPVAQLVEAAAL